MAQTSMSVQGKRSGASPVRFGTILFLASELLFFGGLFAAYFALRAQTSPWPPEGRGAGCPRSRPWPPRSCVISSFTFHAGVSAAERGRLDRFRPWLWVTIALGTGFAVIQLYDYLHLNFEVSSNAYGTMYWAMTGMHGLHVVAGSAPDGRRGDADARGAPIAAGTSTASTPPPTTGISSTSSGSRCS